MRTIEVSTDTFAAIWRLRLPGESVENDVLKRVLSDFELQQLRKEDDRDPDGAEGLEKVRWVDDVVTALKKLGGMADLNEIYRVAENIRSKAGRSIPRTLEATIRRTLEDHSSDSANFRGKDLFRLVGRGRWALR
jgi:hypothetical protein